MNTQPEVAEMAAPSGSLELPEGLREALTGSRGEEGTTLITDLPSVIVGSILSRIHNPFDVASAFRASRVFGGMARSAPFRLRLRPSRYHDVGIFGDDLSSPNSLAAPALPVVPSSKPALFTEDASYPTNGREPSVQLFDYGSSNGTNSHSLETEVSGSTAENFLSPVCPFSFIRTGNDVNKLAAWTRAALNGIRSVMPSTQELDLAGCPILDDDVTGVLADLHCLDRLVLDGCQKLTSSAAHALAMSVRSGPRILSLQRCFRLGPAAAGDLLAATAAEGSQLQAILLSHLDRLDIPQEPLLLNPLGNSNSKAREQMEITKSVGSSDPGAGLRILALHNCGSLGNSQLVAISETCPFLEVLMLGGSGDGLGLSRADVLPQVKATEAVSALVGAAARLPRLRILELTFFTGSVVRAVREKVPKNVYVWDFCDKNSVATAAAFVAVLKSYSQSNGGEDYFFGFPEDPSVGCNIISLHEQDQLESEICPSHKRDRELDGVSDGEGFFSKAGGSQPVYPHQGSDRRWDSNAEDILMALRAGANCSGARRRTPLHVAAALGESRMVANLLSIGAVTRAMKDSAGASALFLAAESGHAQVCGHLLRGGADVLASNRTGETPLYIAALRGHSAAVEVMLRHCQEYGINWQDADVYGDGWTPLMAATVADRQEVGRVLLRAASEQLMFLESKASWENVSGSPRCLTSLQDCGSMSPKDRSLVLREETLSQFGAKDVNPKNDNTSNGLGKLSAERNIFHDKATTLPRPVPQLLDARNRYGQTALHIAARRGFLWFVANLLVAGASPHVQDEYGLRAIDVARKQNHTIVERLLKDWGEERKSGKGSSQAPTSKKQPGARKKGGAASKISSGLIPTNQCSSPRRVPSWVPKNVSVASGESTPDAGSSVSISELEPDIPSLPASPTSIVPSWMHLSPPVSPRVEQQPATTVEDSCTDDLDRRGSPGDFPDLLGSEVSQGHERVQGTQNYWRGRGTRRRTSSGDSNSSISLEV